MLTSDYRETDSDSLRLLGVLARVFPLLRPRLPVLVGAAVLLVLSLGLDLIAPLLLKHLIDTTLTSRELRQLDLIIFLFVGLYSLRFGAELFGGRLRNRFKEDFLLDLRRRVFDHVQTLSIPFFTQRRSGYLTSRILADASLLSGQLLTIFLGSLTNVLLLTGSVVITFWLNWRLSAVLCLVVPVLILVTRWFGARIRHATQETQERVANLNAGVQESLAGVSLIQSYSLEAFATERVGAEMSKLRSVSLRLADLSLFHSTGIIMMTSLAGLSVLWFGSREVVAGTLTLGDLMAFLAYAVNVYRPIQALTSLNLAAQSVRVAASRVFELLDARPTIREAPDAVPLAQPVRGRVSFSDVSFAYEQDDVLADVSFEIEPGMKVALIGHSGAGKTTLMNHLPRFFDPRAGRVEIDGQDLRTLSLSSLRQAIAVVSQETFLFSGTIRDNLLCVRPEAPEEDLSQTLKQAHLDELVKKLPEGLDTEVGERGVRLSGGERQRLSIARALLKDAPILLLDEATSSLDAISENQIRAAIDELLKSGRTCFVIAHRFTTIRDADRILVLDQGKLVGQGTHAELYGNNAVYARLFDEQYSSGPRRRPTQVKVADVKDFLLSDGKSTSRVTIRSTGSGARTIQVVGPGGSPSD